MDEPIQSQEPARTGVVGRILGTFLSPAATFESVRVSSSWIDWVVPLVISATIGIFVAQKIAPIAMRESIEHQRERLEANTALSEEQKKEALTRLDKAQSMGVGKIALVTAPVAALATLAVLSGIFLGISNFLFRGTGTYVKAMAVTAYAGLIHTVEAVILTPLIVMKDTASISMGPALLLPADMVHTWAYRIASGVDLFTIWYLVIVSIGVGAISGVAPKKVGSALFPLWLVWVGVTAFVKSAFGG